jgi:hypothetical protein
MILNGSKAMLCIIIRNAQIVIKIQVMNNFQLLYKII